MPRSRQNTGRSRGSIRALPSGRYQVRVYAGTDSLTGGRNELSAVVATLAEAEKVRTKFLNQLDERRNPRTKATMNQLLDRYLEVLDVEDSTRRTYEGYIDNHIRPAFGALSAGVVDGELLDAFYAQLRKCRRRCRGKLKVEHWTAKEHRCNKRCGPHTCKPLAASTIRQIHWILSGGFERAVRWRWLSVTPIYSADPPAMPTPNPQPPSAAQAARILQAAWDADKAWGTYVWLAMTTGARRGELCAIRRSDVDLDNGVLMLAHSITESGRRQKDTKTHQQRRITLDGDTLDLLRELMLRQDELALTFGVRLGGDAFLFSPSPVCDRPMLPSNVTARYGRLTAQLDIDTTLHKLRHYNATELIAAGVDIRTVAGRLGHGGGGTTTLRVYAAWVNEADQRAAGQLRDRLPRLRRADSPVSPSVE